MPQVSAMTVANQTMAQVKAAIQTIDMKKVKTKHFLYPVGMTMGSSRVTAVTQSTAVSKVA